MAEQQILDLLRIYVLAAATKHVVDAAAEIEKSVLVPTEDISRVQPTIRQLGTRDLRLVVIAATDVRGSNQELAFFGIIALGVDQPELDLRRGHAGAATRHSTPIDRRPQRASTLGQSVTFRDLDIGKRAFDRLDQLRRHHRRADRELAQRAEVERAQIVAMLEKHREHRRDPARIGASVLRQSIEIGARLVRRH